MSSTELKRDRRTTFRKNVTHTRGHALLTELVFCNELAFITWLAWASLVLGDDAVSILIVLLEVGDSEGGFLE